MLRYITAGESHGRALIAVVAGMPAGLTVHVEDVNRELARRQLGYGRGGRMKIEKDTAEILSGVRFGKTIGSPVAVMIENRDWQNWTGRMSVEEAEGEVEKVTQPRPGHADLSGVLKTDQDDVRNILERTSARETAARVTAGALAKVLLKEFGIQVVSQVTAIGGVVADTEFVAKPGDTEAIDASPVRTLDHNAEASMMAIIDEAVERKDTLGGTFEVLVYGCPPGLGGYATWEDRLDGKIARAVMSIQAMKGVEIGEGFGLAFKPGSEAHDEIFYNESRGYYRETNRAGGLEGGMTNGEPVVIRAAMKPIPTLMQPLRSIDIATKQPVEAVKERSDVCAVPAAAIVAEAVVAVEFAAALLEKFGNDAFDDIKAAFKHYIERLQGWHG
ncbi:MAG TPA: chorismate synthase [Candidatus Aquicultor sp.]